MTTPQHPAKFSNKILRSIANMLPSPTNGMTLLDPFAGTGRVHTLQQYGWTTIGIELEPEWAEMHPGTMVGDATALPFEDASIDAAATSPCLARTEKILTADLRWVEAGSITQGDRLLAFNEHSPGVKVGGQRHRRKYEWATVVSSTPDVADCVRVTMENGDSVVTTPEHPWLIARVKRGTADWVASRDLMKSPSPMALKQFTVWGERLESRDAGWLAGMFDGEGSLSAGVHGSPKMMLAQVDGPVMDECGRIASDLGLPINLISRKKTPIGHKPMSNLYINGGFPGILSALGTLRPMRLLSKWTDLDISSRTIQPEMVRIISVEPVGPTEIQVIETTSGTYFGSGYCHHNCYGNRMADNHVQGESDKSTRNTYTHKLGRKLSDNSAATLQWGPKYKALHTKAWTELRRVLKPEAPFVLNIKNHIRSGSEIRVTEWHVEELKRIGFELETIERLPHKGNGFGENGDIRIPYESVIRFRRVA